MRGKLYSKLGEEQNLRKVAELLYIFLITPDEVGKYFVICHYNIKVLNLFHPELLMINTKTIIKNKLNELLSEFKQFKVQSILVLNYQKRNDHKIFH